MVERSPVTSPERPFANSAFAESFQTLLWVASTIHSRQWPPFNCTGQSFQTEANVPEQSVTVTKVDEHNGEAAARFIPAGQPRNVPVSPCESDPVATERIEDFGHIVRGLGHVVSHEQAVIAPEAHVPLLDVKEAGPIDGSGNEGSRDGVGAPGCAKFADPAGGPATRLRSIR